MRRALDDTDNAVAAAHVSSFFQRRQMFDRQVRIQKCVEIPIAHADGQREISFRQRVGDLARIAADEHILLRNLSDIFFPLHVQQKRPHGKAAPRHSRVAQADFTFPFGIEQIVIASHLLRLD